MLAARIAVLKSTTERDSFRQGAPSLVLPARVHRVQCLSTGVRDGFSQPTGILAGSESSSHSADSQELHCTRAVRTQLDAQVVK